MNGALSLFSLPPDTLRYTAGKLNTPSILNFSATCTQIRPYLSDMVVEINLERKKEEERNSIRADMLIKAGFIPNVDENNALTPEAKKLALQFVKKLNRFKLTLTDLFKLSTNDQFIRAKEIDDLHDNLIYNLGKKNLPRDYSFEKIYYTKCSMVKQTWLLANLHHFPQDDHSRKIRDHRFWTDYPLNNMREKCMATEYSPDKQKIQVYVWESQLKCIHNLRNESCIERLQEEWAYVPRDPLPEYTYEAISKPAPHPLQQNKEEKSNICAVM